MAVFWAVKGKNAEGMFLMADEEAKSAAAVWILRTGSNASDEIRERLEEVALRVFPRAEAWSRQELAGSSLADDSAVIWDVWEESLQSVLKTLQRKMRLRPISDLDSYLLGVFCHRLRRRLSKEKRLPVVPLDAELDEFQSEKDWPAELENKLLLEQALKLTDQWTKRMLFRRTLVGDSWGHLGRMSAMSEKTAMKRFAYRLKKLREMIGATERKTTKPV
jgi:DNA-directed RNA polymerase specialized sigma24 family protein